MWIISKSHREKIFFFDIFATHSSSRNEKRCQMSVRLFSLFPGSIYQQWLGTVYLLSLYRYACFVPILRQDYICNLTVYHLDLQNRIYPNVCYAQLKEGSSHFFQDLFGFLKLTIELNNAKVSEFFQKAPK